MTFGAILDALLISPLKLFFEIIFQLAYEAIRDPGISIICLSLAMNFLVLPLYKRADAMQEAARDTEAKLAKGISHIKKTFSGNERFMMLQTYYRQNNYSPLNALKGSVSLLLEIPFFMAAYQFLSHLDILSGTSFGPIANLGAPDGMLTIGALTINVLPVLMTRINFISSAIYLKGFPLKTKVQLYALAIFFLVFLYDSPAGLVFYWTLNNVFSLCKNIVFKIIGAHRKDKVRVKKERKFKVNWKAEPDRKSFIAAAVFLTVLTGLLIPTNFIAASPQEYVVAGIDFNPIWYTVRALCLAAGVFLVWFSVFYWLAGKKGKVIFERAMWIFCGMAVINYMFFGTKLGILSSVLKYQGGLLFTLTEIIVNPIVLILSGIVMLVIAIRYVNLPKTVLSVAAAAMLLMSFINVHGINASLKDVHPQEEKSGPHFELSTEGNNVVVIFLDRAMGEYMPYMLKEKPELKEIFDGFTYYANTISYGGHTNMGAPALMGGYEYTPVEINKRDTEPLVNKHNESLKVMPVLFKNNGFNVTVCDAPYANYKWIPDMSIYDDYPEINTYVTKGFFGDTKDRQQIIDQNMRNFFCFSLMKILPVEFQTGMYDGGHYLEAGSGGNGVSQIVLSRSVSRGMSGAFMESYEVLENLVHMTEVKNGEADNFLFLYNDAPHEPMMLKEPEYVPASQVDNTEYDKTHEDRFTVDGRKIRIEKSDQMIHYQSNMATLLAIGNWLDYLKKNNVYDNTRIILCSDHGYYLYQTQDLQHTVGGKILDLGNFYPLLMVKDFNSRGFESSDEFMTNADVPTLASKDVIQNPVNPFTGKTITADEKTAHDQFILTSRDWNVDYNNGNTFSAGTWAVVTDNIWDRADWQFIRDKVVLKEHVMP